MSKFDRDVRFNVKYGTSIPARVVDVFFGKASVTLLTNGALLRDLDIVGGNVVVGQAVKVDFTTSKPTVLAMGTTTDFTLASTGIQSGGGGGGSVGTVEEGPGIDILINRVGFGGDSCVVYNSDGNPCDEFEATDSGLASALAAMDAGDILEIADLEISGGPWTISSGTVRGHSRYGTILDGEVNVGAGCNLENLSIIRSATSGTLYGVKLGLGSRVSFCYIDLINTANVIGIYTEAGGSYSNDNIVFAKCSSAGTAYGFYAGRSIAEYNGLMYVTGGLVRATTAPVGEQPYE